MADAQPRGDAQADCAEGAPRLADRLEGFVSGRPGARVDADALGRAVIDGDEDSRRPLAGHQPVRSVPHISSTFSVVIVPSCARGPRGAPGR